MNTPTYTVQDLGTFINFLTELKIEQRKNRFSTYNLLCNCHELFNYESVWERANPGTELPSGIEVKFAEDGSTSYYYPCLGINDCTVLYMFPMKHRRDNYFKETIVEKFKFSTFTGLSTEEVHFSLYDSGTNQLEYRSIDALNYDAVKSLDQYKNVIHAVQKLLQIPVHPEYLFIFKHEEYFEEFA